MNVEVLGDDVTDSLLIIGTSIGKQLGGKLTPTQKAELEKFNIDAATKADHKDLTPYIIGGAVIAAIVMFAVMKRR